VSSYIYLTELTIRLMDTDDPEWYILLGSTVLTHTMTQGINIWGPLASQQFMGKVTPMDLTFHPPLPHIFLTLVNIGRQLIVINDRSDTTPTYKSGLYVVLQNWLRL
jgi:hypothetical protein